jgi:ribosomal subunit interface protein
LIMWTEGAAVRRGGGQMNFQFTFRHMDTSEALEGYAAEKLREPIDKFVTKAIDAHVTFSVQRHQHTAHLHLRAGDGFGIEVEHTSQDMYASVDQMVDKLATQLRKQKEKLKDHKAPKLHERMAEAGVENAPVTAAAPEALVDAGDIVKFEQAKKRNAH